jgi:hypothetical protein
MVSKLNAASKRRFNYLADRLYLKSVKINQSSHVLQNFTSFRQKISTRAHMTLGHLVGV